MYFWNQPQTKGQSTWSRSLYTFSHLCHRACG